MNSSDNGKSWSVRNSSKRSGELICFGNRIYWQVRVPEVVMMVVKEEEEEEDKELHHPKLQASHPERRKVVCSADCLVQRTRKGILVLIPVVALHQHKHHTGDHLRAKVIFNGVAPLPRRNVVTASHHPKLLECHMPVRLVSAPHVAPCV